MVLWATPCQRNGAGCVPHPRCFDNVLTASNSPLRSSVFRAPVETKRYPSPPPQPSIPSLPCPALPCPTRRGRTVLFIARVGLLLYSILKHFDRYAGERDRATPSMVCVRAEGEGETTRRSPDFVASVPSIRMVKSDCFRKDQRNRRRDAHLPPTRANLPFDNILLWTSLAFVSSPVRVTC